MDETNPAITFDASGQCNCCRDALARAPHEWWPGSEGAARMRELSATLKADGRGRDYDAIIGLSGGVDSAYVAHVAGGVLGLRLLAVHVDGGWNTEPAVRNIESIVRGLGIDLYTCVVEWTEMRDLQVAFLKSGVLNQDIPQDHAFFAILYRTAAKFGMRHILSGVNFSTESVSPPDWGFSSLDGDHVRAIHRRFGRVPLESYPVMSLAEYLWMTRVRRSAHIHRPLNFVNYVREEARLELDRTYGWRDYGVKHGESRFTKFYQEQYLPRRYGFDKRRVHLSSLIVSGQFPRERALSELETPIVEADAARRDLRFVAKKLDLSIDELESLIDAPPVSHTAYGSTVGLQRRLTAVRATTRRLSQRGRLRRGRPGGHAGVREAPGSGGRRLS